MEIADSLDCAHRLGVIHRDLKPSNIILTESGAKLLDFGIAKLLDRDEEQGRDGAPAADPTLTDRGRVIGTAAYMSPEQVRGEPIDERSDLFSFGAVLYEMATGTRAFAGADRDAVRAAILRGMPHPAVAGAPARLAGIIGRALEPDRGRRYPHAFEIKTDLQRLAVSAAPPRKRATMAMGVAAALLLTIAATASGVLLTRGSRAAPPATGSRRSVAVLPFKPLAPGTPEDNYIGMALADSLITELGAFKTMAVRPLSASSRYAGKRDVMAAGRELQAELVLDGATQRAGDRLRVSAALVRSADGLTVWSQRFDLPWTDVFHVQDTIADQVGRALAAALPGEDRQRVERRRTRDVEAYEAYLKGRYFWNMRTIDALQRARVYFQQAIDKDAGYAPAYAGLADTYAMLGSMPYAVMPASDASVKAKAAAEKALQIDDTLADAHVSLAFVTYAFDWQWQVGEREFRRAIELDPSYQTAHIWYALYLGQLGRIPEAIAEAERSRELDPLSLIGTYAVGLSHYFGRRYDAAEAFARKTLEIDANFPSARRLLGQVYTAQGRHAEALAEFQRLNDTAHGNWLHMALLAHAYGRANEPAKARKILADMIDASKTRFVPPAQIAIGYVGLGDRDAAFTWLEHARAEHSQVLNFLKMDPMFDALRSDVRYPELLRGVGLSDK